jgi:glycosyltransferase involved in cell wall biosynthesis
MKILQVVTFISPDNSYGGPSQVAMNQAIGLASLGNEVTLLSLSPNKWISNSKRKYKILQYRAYGKNTLKKFTFMHNVNCFYWMLINCTKFDVIHIHYARNIFCGIIGIICRLRKVDYVLQTHGMVSSKEHPLVDLYDYLFVKNVMARSLAVLFLTEYESRELYKVSPDSNFIQLSNGVQLRNKFEKREPLIIFAARLALRKNPMIFAMSAIDCKEDFQFEMYGPDEGQLINLRKVLEELKPRNLKYMGHVENETLLARMDHASIFCLPSVLEPFPVAVLEALSCGLPVIVSNTCGLSQQIMEYRAGLVVEPNSEEILQAVKIIMSNWNEFSTNARKLAEERFENISITNRLISIYSMRDKF